MHSPSFLAVDCGASHVAIGRFRGAPEGRVALDSFATEALPNHLPDDASWVAATSAAAKRIAGHTGWRGRCTVGLAGHLTLQKTLRMPRLSARRRRPVMRFEVAQSFPCAAAAMHWSCLPVSADREGEEVVITAVRTETVEALCAGLQQAGFWPRVVLPAWLVLREGFPARCPPPAPELVAAIGARSTQLVLIGGSAVFARTLALGGEGVSQAIAEQLHVSLDRAERIKLEVGRARSAPEAGAPEAMAAQIAADQFIRRLDSEILRSLAGVSPGNEGPRPARVRLIGGASLLGAPAALLTRRLSLRAELWQEPSTAGRADDSREAQPGTGALEAAHRTDLILVGQCAASARAAAASLLPPSARRHEFLRRWRAPMAAAALSAVGGLGLLILHVQSVAREDRQAALALDAKIAAYRRLEARQRATLAELQETNGRIKAVKRLVEAQSAWVGFMSDLQERLTRGQDAWLERLQLVPVAAKESAKRKPSPAPMESGAPIRASDPRRRLLVTACLFDAEHPLDLPGDGAYRRAKALLDELRASPYVVGTGEERFDGGRPGVLRCSVTLDLVPGLLF